MYPTNNWPTWCIHSSCREPFQLWPHCEYFGHVQQHFGLASVHMSSVPVGHRLPPLLLPHVNIIKTGQHGTHLYSHSEGESLTPTLAPWSSCGQQSGGIAACAVRGRKEHSIDAKYRRWTISEHAMERLYYMTPSKLIVAVHEVWQKEPCTSCYMR